MESLAELFGAFEDDNGYDKEKRSLQWRVPENHHPDSPFHLVNLPSEDVARNIANRSTLRSHCVFVLLHHLFDQMLKHRI